MALDEALLRADPIVPTLRTYAWNPWTLSLGYFQMTDPDVIASVRGEGLGVVRRPTGGGAIFHGPELTYAVICPLVVHGILSLALGELGTPAEMRGNRILCSDTRCDGEFWCFYDSTSFDLVLGDRKLVGSAQRRTGRGFLMHGSIPLAQNRFTPETATAGASYDELEEALARAAADTLGVRLIPGVPTPEETESSRHLTRSRYQTEEWIFRRSPSSG